MRRAAVPIGSNIFEGCGRQSNTSLIAFLYIAHGSAAELLFQLRLARRRGFGDATLAAKLDRQIHRIRQMLARLIKHLEDPSAVPARSATPRRAL
jgi:four helix bundle protein